MAQESPLVQHRHPTSPVIIFFGCRQLARHVPLCLSPSLSAPTYRAVTALPSHLTPSQPLHGSLPSQLLSSSAPFENESLNLSNSSASLRLEALLGCTRQDPASTNTGSNMRALPIKAAMLRMLSRVHGVAAARKPSSLHVGSLWSTLRAPYWLWLC